MNPGQLRKFKKYRKSRKARKTRTTSRGKGIFDGIVNRGIDRAFNKLDIKIADDAINKLTSSLINNAIDIPAGRIKKFSTDEFIWRILFLFEKVKFYMFQSLIFILLALL